MTTTRSRQMSRGAHWSHAACAALLVLLAMSIAAAAASATPLSEKRAQAARIGAQVDKMDEQLAHLQERLRGANARLDELDGELDQLNSELRIQERELGVARGRLVTRAVTVYRSGSANSQLLNLVQAGSMANFVDRMDTIRRVSKQDADVLAQIRVLRRRVATKRGQIKDARDEQKLLVERQRKDRDSLSRKVNQRKQVLSSVNAEIRSMVEAERRAAAARAAAASRAAAERLARRRAAAAPPAATGGTTQGNEPSPASTEPPPGPSSSTDVGTALGGGGSAPPASGKGSAAVAVAMRYIGTPYVWGGSSPSGFDCSGLVMYSYSQVGVSLPRTTYSMWNAGPHVSRGELQVGDLVFFSGLGHMGMYAGGGSYIHSPRRGDVVKISSMSDRYANGNYMGAVRITG